MGTVAGVDLKKRTISAEALGPLGSVCDPLGLPPDHAWPAWHPYLCAIHVHIIYARYAFSPHVGYLTPQP